jgi:hypothetical protein
MYWLRDGNPFSLILWLGLLTVSLLGGWLLVSKLFKAEKHERLILGFGIGLLGFIWLSNFTIRFIPGSLAYIVSAIALLALGVAVAWLRGRPYLCWNDFSSWKILLVTLLLIAVLTRVEQGLGISEDNKNITLISRIAAGDVPPHHYTNNTLLWSTHYGFHILGGSMMRVGGMFPWSSYDLSKGIAYALSIILQYLVIRRYIPGRAGAILAAAATVFIGGTRFLLLLTPIPMQGSIETVMGVGFFQKLASTVGMEGGPPIPYLNAFMSGLNGTSMTAHAGYGAISSACILIIWLLYDRSSHKLSFLLFAPLLAVSALSNEVNYGLFGIGLAAVLLVRILQKRSHQQQAVVYLFLAFILSVVLVCFQGGVITQRVSSIASGLFHPSPAAPLTGEPVVKTGWMGFSLRWPPAIRPGSTGYYFLFKPVHLLMLFCEIGPMLLFVPWIVLWMWRKFRAGDNIVGIFLITSVCAFLFPIFIRYYVDRDIVRFTSYAIHYWEIFWLFFLWQKFSGWRKSFQVLGFLSLGLMLVGGIVQAGNNVSAMLHPVLTPHINSLDARISRDTWGKLESEKLIFDPIVWRGPMLTGNPTISNTAWLALEEAPSISGLLQNNFLYAYYDQDWWVGLPQESQASLSDQCVKIVSEYIDDWPPENPAFRRLISLENCIQ